MADNISYTPSGNSNYIYGQPGNAPYYGGGNYSAGGNTDPNQEEEGGGFNIMEWVMLCLHYWYLFVIGAAIALGVAMLKNRKWLPAYYSQGTIIIKESGYYGGSNASLMQGFGVDAGYKNVKNQVIMLGSYDLMCRVVDSLPFMQTEYITKGRFKSRNLYHNTPVLIEQQRIDPMAYELTFRLDIHPDGTLSITSTDEDVPLEVSGNFNESIQSSLFDIVIRPSLTAVSDNKVYFRFRTKQSLIDEFMGRVQFHFVNEGSTVLAISLTSETPQRDCELIDKLAEIYLLQNLERKNEVADNSIHFINQQLNALQSSLSVSEGALTQFKQENRFVDVSSYAGQLMNRISQYDQQSMSLQLKETYFDYLTNYLQTNIESGAVIAPTSLGLNEPILMTLVQQLNDLRIQRGELSEIIVYYAKYSTDIENVKTAINEVVSSMRASLEIEKKDLKARFADVEAEMQKLPSKELQMVAIERNYRIDDNYYTFFLQKRAEAEIQKAGNTPDNTVLDKARTTAIVNAKTKSKTTTTALIIGLLIPLGLIILSELLNNKLRSPKDVKKLGLFNMIGALRHARVQNPTLVHDKPRSSYAEMLRSIRTRVEFLIKRKEGIVLTLTSTESGDGKTFLSTNLASLYAMTGKKTLLIDVDIRKPNIHTKLGLENGNGLTNYLIGDCPLEDTMITNTPFGFDVMRAGTVPPNPGELIHSDKMAELLTSLRKEYAFIVMDTSPIGLVPDAYTLIELSDVCLFVIRYMQTGKSFCKQTLQQLSEMTEHPEKIQLVLSDIPNEGRFAYGYGYGYGGYGYGYGYGYGSGYSYGYGQKMRDTERKYGRYGAYIYHKLHRKRKGENYYAEEEEA